MPLLREAESAAAKGRWVALAVSYDAAPAFDDALTAHRSSDFPLVWAGFFDQPAPLPDARPAEDGHAAFHFSDWAPAVGRADYEASVSAIRSYIAAGDTYQVNYTFPMRSRLTGDAHAAFNALGISQRAEYSALLEIGDQTVMSFSPELFFEWRGDRLTTRPMKGTTQRGRWLEEDDERSRMLAASAKDRAENVMIVDLLRNDIGKVAAVGTVEVPELFAVGKLGQVLQMTSTVTCRTRPEVTLVDIFRALFPCGSITGAPKVRSMEIIGELEASARGIYSGAIGYLAPDGDAVFNVAIRTISVEKDGASTFGVGGGITWGSTPAGEYEECLLKAKFLTTPSPGFSLLETLALRAGEYALLDRHVARARSSAEYFGFGWKEDAVRDALDDIARAHGSGEWRVRFTSSPAGEVATQAERLQPLSLPRRVRFAGEPIDSRDPLWFHKTTARERYDRALARCQPCDDVIFWNERGEITESTIANIVVTVGGAQYTPPRSAGLLAGTLRDQMIENGELSERAITKDELASAHSFALINSVRGRQDALLLD